MVLSCGCCRHGLGIFAIFCEKFEFIFVGFWIIIYVNTGRIWGFELDLRIWILSLQGCNDLITGDD